MFDYISSIFSDFSNPTQRIFFGYLVIAAIIAFFWLLLIRRLSPTDAIAKIFDRKIIFSRSALADYKIFILNRIFFLFVSPLFLTQSFIAVSIYFFLLRLGWLEYGILKNVPLVLMVALFSAAMFIFDDLTKYLVHRWMHRWPVLWSFHKVHHSAETMTPITVYRIHPLEGVVSILRSAVTQGVVISVFAFLFGDFIDLFTVLGVNLFVFAFHATGSNLRHSHIKIRYWNWLEYLLISPAQHQLHHSTAIQHHDKNFGSALAIWDWLFGSHHLSADNDEPLIFGLKAAEISSTDILDLYGRPLKEIARLTLRNIQKSKL